MKETRCRSMTSIHVDMKWVCGEEGPVAAGSQKVMSDSHACRRKIQADSDAVNAHMRMEVMLMKGQTTSRQTETEQQHWV